MLRLLQIAKVWVDDSFGICVGGLCGERPRYIPSQLRTYPRKVGNCSARDETECLCTSFCSKTDPVSAPPDLRSMAPSARLNDLQQSRWLSHDVVECQCKASDGIVSGAIEESSSWRLDRSYDLTHPEWSNFTLSLSLDLEALLSSPLESGFRGMMALQGKLLDSFSPEPK